MLMGQYKSSERRAWIQHYQANGNVAATCRHFSISRVTFYKWLRRFDPDKPSKPLLPRSRKPLTKQNPRWTLWDLRILAALDKETGARLGAGRLAKRLPKYGIHFSRATVGRMLAKVRRRCPLCRGKNRHDPWMHALSQDLLWWEVHREEERVRLGLGPLPTTKA